MMWATQFLQQFADWHVQLSPARQLILNISLLIVVLPVFALLAVTVWTIVARLLRSCRR